MTINRALLILLAVLLMPSLAWAQTNTRATFNVLKDFTDGNDAVVQVQIDCNSGLILDQDKDISDDGLGVQFVVTEFTAGLPTNCTVTEDPVTGYSTVYWLNGSSLEESAEGCAFLDIQDGGDYDCTVVNTPDPVEVIIYKEWIIEGSGGDQLDAHYKLELWCDAEIEDGYYSYGNWKKSFYGEGTSGEQYHAFVTPDWDGGSNCWVDETVYDSSIETDSDDCDDLHVEIALGDSCTVTNTVFYEGIPTLSQYGMAILALLMLGVGFVGFRRFV